MAAAVASEAAKEKVAQQLAFIKADDPDAVPLPELLRSVRYYFTRYKNDISDICWDIIKLIFSY
jgi:hypothetical protein